jgi:hypothetical protein
MKHQKLKVNGADKRDDRSLIFTQNIIEVIKARRMRWARHVMLAGEMRNAYKILDEKPEGRIPCGKLRYRWEDNITRLEKCNLEYTFYHYYSSHSS